MYIRRPVLTGRVPVYQCRDLHMPGFSPALRIFQGYGNYRGILYATTGKKRHLIICTSNHYHNGREQQAQDTYRQPTTDRARGRRGPPDCTGWSMKHLRCWKRRIPVVSGIMIRHRHTLEVNSITGTSGDSIRIGRDVHSRQANPQSGMPEVQTRTLKVRFPGWGGRISDSGRSTMCGTIPISGRLRDRVERLVHFARPARPGS